MIYIAIPGPFLIHESPGLWLEYHDGASSAAGTAYHFGAPEVTPGFQ